MGPDLERVFLHLTGSAPRGRRMRSFLALLIKEEKALFTSPIAYVVLAVFLLIMGYTFTLDLVLSACDDARCICSFRSSRCSC